MCVMMMEGGEEKLRTNVNFLLEEYGIMVNTGKGEGRGEAALTCQQFDYAIAVLYLEKFSRERKADLLINSYCYYYIVLHCVLLAQKPA